MATRFVFVLRGRMPQYLKILFSRLYLLAAQWENTDTGSHITVRFRLATERNEAMLNQYPILQRCDIYWISTGIKLNQSYVTLFDRADTLALAGKVNLTSGLLLGRSAEVLRSLRHYPLEAMDWYYTIIDRLDTKVGRLWVTLLGNLQPPPEPKNNEERVPSPVTVLHVYIRHCTNNPYTHPSRLWSARTATRTGFPFILMSRQTLLHSCHPRLVVPTFLSVQLLSLCIV